MTTEQTTEQSDRQNLYAALIEKLFGQNLLLISRVVGRSEVHLHGSKYLYKYIYLVTFS